MAIVSSTARPASSQESELREIFHQLDEDGNGVVDRIEFETRKVLLLETRDTDKNNYITPDESVATKAEFAQADADGDGDGALSGLEWVTADFTNFEALDGNRDGALTFDEIEAFRSLFMEKDKP